MSIDFNEPTKYVVLRHGASINGPRAWGEVIEATGLRNLRMMVEQRKLRAVPADYPVVEYDGREFISQDAVDGYKSMKVSEQASEVVVEPTNGDEGSDGADAPETIEEVGERLGKLNKAELLEAATDYGVEVDPDSTKANIVESIQIALMERAEQGA